MTTGSNAMKWPISYSAGANGEGWTKVSLTLEVNAGTLVANSISGFDRYELKSDPTDAMYIDNVKIIRWVDTRVEDLTPVLKTTEELTFNKADAKDVTLVIDTKGETLNNIKRGGVNVNAVSYTKTQKGDECTVTFKSDYLKSLDDGEHTFTANTIEGSVEFKIKVVNEKSGGCKGDIELTCGALFLAAITAAVVLKRKKSV